AKGAIVTVNSDGSFEYDPTGSAELQAIPAAQTATDTFTYTITDGTSTDIATVTVTVTGTNDAPVLNRNLYDLLVVEDAPSTFIDLNRYFGDDAEGTSPSFTVHANDNTSLVTTSI